MRLKSRKPVRALLCVLIAACLAGGSALLQLSQRAGWETAPTTDTTMWSETEPTTRPTSEEGYTEETAYTTAPAPQESTTLPASESTARTLWVAAAVLLVLGLLSAALYILLLPQKRPFLGPEAEMLLLPPALYLFLALRDMEPLPGALLQFLLAALLLYLLHGLWSWVYRQLPLSWSAVWRISERLRVRSAGACLLFQSLWTAGAALCAAVCLALCVLSGYFAIFCAVFALVMLLSLLCVRKTAQAVDHLTQQIGVLHEGGQVAANGGMLAQAEIQLSELGTQRDEAIRTAVTSERFKVELISNVSHDLRTPLTAILGYGELLQTEALSEQGREQLNRLNQKAGYMRELVESLFELTKVSSGAEALKVEQLDLIRLL